MYVKAYGTVYSSKLSDTEKVARRSLAVSDKKPDGTYETEYWDARFVGKAKDLVDTLPEKTRVEIQGNVHTGYDKEKHQSFPYILVTVAEVVNEQPKGLVQAILLRQVFLFADNAIKRRFYILLYEKETERQQRKNRKAGPGYWNR